MNSSIYKAQMLLYKWLTHFERKSYNSINEVCEYLNEVKHLDIHGKPIWKLFFPLVMNGVVDYAGKDSYSVAPPLILTFKSHSYLLNGDTSSCDINVPVGYRLLESNDSQLQFVDNVGISTFALLKSFPAIDDIVKGWNWSTQDETILEYHNLKTHIGVAEIKNGMSRYFSIPNESFMKEIPSRSANPDAYNIGIYYERIVNNEKNGYYNSSIRELKMCSFGIPFILFRALMIDGLEKKMFPAEEKDVYVFYNISPKVVKELNRILCKSISYE